MRVLVLELIAAAPVMGVAVASVAGLTAGAIHVLAGPDHLAAVAPLSARQRGRGWLAGLWWGLGHCGGVLLVALALLLLRETLNVEAVSHYSEMLVGLVLIGVGAWALRQALRMRIHAHPDEAAQPDSEQHLHTHAALPVGMLHGFAGSSHLFAVMPALLLPTWLASSGYLFGYAAGTVLAMVAFGALLGWLAQNASARGPILFRNLLCICAIGAIVVGVFWLIPTGEGV